MPTKTLMNAEEFARTGSETDGFELVRGELTPMPPPQRKHRATCINAAFLLKAYTKAIGRGAVLGNDTGLITRRGSDTVRGVDIMVYLAPSWADKAVPDGYCIEPPDLAVEVRSPEQSWNDMLEKVTEYLRLGTPLVWIIDPKTERVHVFRPHEEPQVFAAGNDLDGGDVLPGFHCKVSELFTL